MPLESGAMTVNELIEKLQGMDAGELPIKVSNYEGDHGLTVYTIRKHVIMNEEDEVTDAYVVVNG